MKTALLTLALAAASFAAAAQSAPATPAAATAASAASAGAYTTLMLATIAEQDNAAPAALPANIAKLERAASAKPADWLPRYYQARAYIRLGFMGQGAAAQDKLFDQAQAALDQATKLPGADQSEILVLQAYLYQGRIMVAPAQRGMAYGSRVSEALSMAEALSPANPRIALLRGNDLFYRPAMFGGGADKAQPFYQLAVQRFATFKPASPLSPNWGDKQAATMLAKAAAVPAGISSQN